MTFQVRSEIAYEAYLPSTLILNIQALRMPTQTVLAESFMAEPALRLEELPSPNGDNRLIRLEIPEPGPLRISYTATVETQYELTEQQYLADVPVIQLDASILPFLFPSRYCQSDKLYRVAYSQFAHIENAHAKVLAVADWIYNNVEYLSGSTNAQTSACDTITERAGVCRDFAHLGIALCRALTIPARYVTCYAYQVIPPDFHACFEAYIGGKWLIFDATKRAPLNGLVRIATGRDAADAAVASLFGDVAFLWMHVSCEVNDTQFVPFAYDSFTLKGLSYQ